MKDHIPSENKPEIYQISCRDCEKYMYETQNECGNQGKTTF